MLDDGRLDMAKSLPLDEVIARLGIAGLRRNGAELTGPCPICGGRDRFNINTRSRAFLCRQCDLRGGDMPGLVMGVMGVALPKALEFLIGGADLSIDPAEVARRRAKAAEAAARSEATAARYRARRIAEAQAIWNSAQPGEDTPVRAYLALRGLRRDLLPRWPHALRFLPDHPARKDIGGTVRVIHRGPCMIAAVVNPRGDVTAVHQTWLDLSQAKGRARIAFGGQDYPSKMVLGSKKGGAIRLFGRPGRIATLIMGEGIETTLSALPAAPQGAGLWAGVDLGNMSGRMQPQPGTRHSGLPDMTDGDAFVPPPGLSSLVFVQDGDSDPAATRARMLSGLRRAMAHFPGLRARLVHPGAGRDLNDLLRDAAQEQEEYTDGQN